MSEQFRLPRPNVIESDRGFSVEVLGRTGLRYSVGSKVIDVGAEVLAGPAGIAVFADTVRYWSEPPEQPVTAQERSAILDDIRRAFRFRGFDIQIM
jgi:hypothetical protein